MIVKDTGKSRRVALVLGLVCLVFQLGFAPNIGLFGGRVNMALVFVGCTCLGAEPGRAPIYGFVAGLLYDLCGTGPIGLMALVLTVAGWLLAAFDHAPVSDDLTGSLALFVPCALAVNLLYAFVLLAFGQATSVVDTLFLRALPATLLDCVAFALVAFVLSRTGTGSKGGLSLGGPGRRRSGGPYSLKKGL